ncbi:MAG: hypothetical protein COA43_10680 [Robiginitomaculum sp.]|nr:MAG: hypothetical protein COA43_10680 [Robiginitomaculum sp.]
MAKSDIIKASSFDFGEAVSVLFKQQGGRNFTIRLVLWSAVLLMLVFALCGKTYMEMMGVMLEASWIAQQDGQTPEAILGAYKGFGKYVPIMVAMTIGTWAVYASAETALQKRVFKNIDYGFIPLRFGRDELRTMGTQFMVYLMVLGVMLLWMLGFIIVTIVFALGASLSVVLAILIGIVLFVMYIAMFVYLIHFSIRMAPSAALGTQSGKMKVTGGWNITRKRTGSLFLAYLFIAVVSYIALSIIQVAMFSLVLPENYMLLMMGLSEENPRILFEQIGDKLQSPGPMLALVISGMAYAIITMMGWLSISGIAIYAVQWWQHDQETSGVDVFD